MSSKRRKCTGHVWWAEEGLVRNIMMGKPSDKKPIERPRQNRVALCPLLRTNFEQNTFSPFLEDDPILFSSI